MSKLEKDWWAPVWRGLVDDPEAKHYRALRISVWLLLYFFLHVDRQTGATVRKQETIARDTGWAIRTIRSWMRELERAGYIVVARSGRAARIQVVGWRPIGRGSAGQTGRDLPIRPAKIGTARPPVTPKVEQGRAEIDSSPDPNKSSSTRIPIQECDAVLKNQSWSGASEEVSDLEARRMLLARDLAEGLGDQGNLQHYVSLASRYPDDVLRRLMSEARAVPEREIRKSRPALFNHLLKRYDQRTKENPRD